MASCGFDCCSNSPVAVARRADRHSSSGCKRTAEQIGDGHHELDQAPAVVRGKDDKNPLTIVWPMAKSVLSLLRCVPWLDGRIPGAVR